MTKKNIIFITLAFLFSLNMNAQKALNEVATLLESKDYAKAKSSIDALCVGNEFSNNAKAWYLKAVVYQTLLAEDKSGLANSNTNQTAFDAYKKVFQIDPKYKVDNDFANNLSNLMIGFYNDGINNYNSKKWSDAVKNFENIKEVAKLDNAKALNNMKMIDTINAQARMYQAYSSYQNNNLDNAMALLEEVSENPITTNEDIYYMLINIYREKQNTAKWLPTIEKAKKQYPNNKILTDEELNYYILNNEQQKLAAMLEKLVEKDASNAEYFFNLGTTYERIAKPTDKTGTELAKPSNYNEIIVKAENAYKKAISLNDKNGGYQYNLGALYYNQAVEINKSMGEKGIAKAKFEEFKKQRNDLFAKSTPYMEKALSIFEAASGKDENKLLHKQCLQGLKNMYNLMENKAKTDVYTKKIAELK